MPMQFAQSAGLERDQACSQLGEREAAGIDDADLAFFGGSGRGHRFQLEGGLNRRGHCAASNLFLVLSNRVGRHRAGEYIKRFGRKLGQRLAIETKVFPQHLGGVCAIHAESSMVPASEKSPWLKTSKISCRQGRARIECGCPAGKARRRLR